MIYLIHFKAIKKKAFPTLLTIYIFDRNHLTNGSFLARPQQSRKTPTLA